MNYIEQATRTESVKQQIIANKPALLNLIDILIIYGNIADNVKKQIFYDKPFKLELQHTLLDTYNFNQNKQTLNIDSRLFHGIIGICTESIELLQALKFDGSPLDKVNLIEELGDILWYVLIMCDQLDVSLDTVIQTMIDKLQTRYPEKYTNERAIQRNIKKERNILQTSIDKK